MAEFREKLPIVVRGVVNWPIRHPAFCLAGILLLSFTAKLVAMKLEPAIGRDSCLYLYMAQIWEETGSYEGLLREIPKIDRIPSLLPFLIKSMGVAGIPAETAGLAVNILLGGLIPLVGFGIAFEATEDKKIALMAALLLAVHPKLTDLATEIQRDAPYLFFSGCAVWFTLTGLRRQKLTAWCGAGIALGFALLLRYETMEFLLLLSAAAPVCAMVHLISWKKAVLYSSSLLVCTAVIFYVLILLMGTQAIISSYTDYTNLTINNAGKTIFGLPKSAEE